ncbi:ribonuclease HII [bacterium]|nr:ribonuclease HII [bacterium]
MMFRPCPMWRFDEEIRRSGCEALAGVDEVGRGCLAGPVVAAAVMLRIGFSDSRIRDSKQLTAKAREELINVIDDNAVTIGICEVAPGEIDRINIRQASLQAMAGSVYKLAVRTDIVLVDGIAKFPGTRMQMTVKHGDAKSLSIASASIIAKVYRDRLMCKLDAKYPQYRFSSNKGYGTREHLAALEKHGPCAIHRRSFAPVRRALENEIPLST